MQTSLVDCNVTSHVFCRYRTCWCICCWWSCQMFWSLRLPCRCWWSTWWPLSQPLCSGHSLHLIGKYHHCRLVSWFTWRVQHVVQFEIVPHVMEGCWRHVQHDLIGGLLVSVHMVGRVRPRRGEWTCRIQQSAFRPCRPVMPWCHSVGNKIPTMAITTTLIIDRFNSHPSHLRCWGWPRTHQWCPWRYFRQTARTRGSLTPGTS